MSALNPVLPYALQPSEPVRNETGYDFAVLIDNKPFARPHVLSPRKPHGFGNSAHYSYGSSVKPVWLHNMPPVVVGAVQGPCRLTSGRLKANARPVRRFVKR